MALHLTSCERAEGNITALSELKVIVVPYIPADQLWVHPAMFDRLQQAFLEADNRRALMDWVAEQP